MIRLWFLELKVLWRSEHIWAFYMGLFILYLSKFVFFIDELPVTIPLYGLFMSIMTLVILNSPRRYNMVHIIRLTNWNPIRRTLQSWLFSFLCTLPASTLLFFTVREIFKDTPVYLLVFVILGLSYFAISFAFVISLLSFKMAILCCVSVYMLLTLMHGYKLESIRYAAPTLNFMYPDYPDMRNMLSIFFLGILMLGIYLWKGIDWPRRQKRSLLFILMMFLVIYIAVPIQETWNEMRLANEPYQKVQVNNIVVQYKGIPQSIATRYSQVVSDIIEELKEHEMNPEITRINITRLGRVPKGTQLEHIMKLEEKTLYIEPYSNKFYEFNYGYNIIRDMLELSGIDHQIGQQITESLIRKNKHHFFDSLQRRGLSETYE